MKKLCSLISTLALVGAVSLHANDHEAAKAKADHAMDKAHKAVDKAGEAGKAAEKAADKAGEAKKAAEDAKRKAKDAADKAKK